VNNASTLHAYDATNLANEVYNSNQASGSRDRGGPPIKFAVPTVANGKVFVGAQYELDVYGMLGSSGTRLAAPVFTPGAGSYSAPQAVTISAAAGATIHYTLDGSPPTLASPTYVNPIPVTAAATVRAIAVKGGALTSPAASASYTIAPPPPQIAFVQGNYATPQTAQAGVSVRYTAMQSAGDLNVVIVGWGDTTATVQSVTDTSGNTYVRAVGPTLMTGTLSQSIYYAKNILAPGANTVSVSFSAPAVYPDIRILEYRGLDPANPLDVVAAAVGSNATPNSGAATTTAANELIVGADLTTGATVAAGSGFTSRMITVPDADIAEDQVVASTGSYAATASAPGGPWLMQMATFKAAGAGAPATPSAPGTLTASAAGVTAVNLSWGAATETGGTIAQYLIERCQGAGCSNFAQIGTASAPTTSFADSGLTGSSSYSYRVRAKDASGNTGPYSNSATAVTAAATPGAPAALAASAAGSAQINLTWSAATETGGTIAQYLIERCQGSGCSSFTQVGTATTLAFSDTGLSAATAYSYRVRAKDTVGTTGPYSNVASASTAAAAPTISAPGALTASATSATQVTLSWGAATETGGTLSQYLIERCQGAGCSSFTQVATVSVPGTTFADTGLTGSTSYSYRVRAKDTAGNTGPYSNVASATTGTVAPTISAPGTLSAGATSATQIGLSWGAATETGGTLSQYLIERCQGAGCSSFTQVGTAAVPATTFTDSGLTAGTSYSYRVRAQDTAGNTGPYSNTATSVTVTGTPSAPSGLAASAASSTQVNLSWSAATETGGSIAQYLIERCQGAGCSSFTQVGTATQLSFSDSALSGSTAYSYRVRAKDAAGNTGPYSNVATATTAAPTLTAPTALSASSVSSTQINLTWGAASETGGVISQYRVERCQGAGCSTFAQIGTATGTSYNDAGLTASTAYSYRVRAADAGGNTGPYSNLASATTASAGGGGGGPITFVQTSNATPQTPQGTVTVRFNATQVAGDLNVVVVGWGDTTAAVGTVTDSVGNVYRLAVGPTAISGTATQAIYYAANIVGAAAGANSVTVSFTAAAIYPDIRLAEYSGIDPNNPLDVVASATGNSAASTTPPVTTTFANDLLIGANLVQSLTITGGSGFSTRVITSPDGDILEDRIVTATGSYSASANIAAAPWIMQLAAFRRHP
jgi:chitodextrinase